MCGIVGIISRTDPQQRADRARVMNAAISHRGPDDEGYFTDDHCSLGMKRLAIVDLYSGRQPITLEDRYTIVFNGEVYNYIELRSDLQHLGCSFTTESDTEVVLRAFIHWGEAAFSKFRGMFAFCIYDTQTKDSVICRDAFGEKPLYYYHDEDEFIFASELPALITNASISRKLNRKALVNYFYFRFSIEPETLLEDVFTLEPGCFLKISGNKVRKKKYFSLEEEFTSHAGNIFASLDETKFEIQHAITASVKRQLRADVDVGAFLSGGIDSSIITSELAKHHSGKLKTFTVKFNNAAYDESKIALEVAKKYDTDHHELFISDSSFEDGILDLILSHFGYPFPDSSAIPTYLVTKEISKNVKVAIGGDGGDELFGGYRSNDWYRRIVNLKSGMNENLLSMIYKFANKTSLSSSRYVKGLKNALLPYDEIAFDLQSLFSRDELHGLLSEKELDFPKSKHYPELTTLRQIMLYRLKYNFNLDMLPKLDRMSMANSLEVRSPFIDVDLFRKSLRIHDKYLQKGEHNKIVLRHIYGEELPNSVFAHKKVGFRIPLHEYLGNKTYRLYDEFVLNNPDIENLLDGGFLHDMKNKFQGKQGEKPRNYHKYWSILLLGVWMKKYNITS
jgi:asparagine synthase (glutamine-hydrolysing)